MADSEDEEENKKAASMGGLSGGLSGLPAALPISGGLPSLGGERLHEMNATMALLTRPLFNSCVVGVQAWPAWLVRCTHPGTSGAIRIRIATDSELEKIA